MTTTYDASVVRRRVRSASGPVVGGVAILAGAVVGIGLAALADLDQLPPNPYLDDQFLLGLAMVPVGLAVAHRRPDHPIGWLLAAAGIASWGAFSGFTTINWLFVHSPGADTAARAILALTIPLWILGRGIVLIHIPLSYPARPPTRSARALWWAGWAATAVTCVAHARFHTFDGFAGVPATGTRRLAEQVLPWGHRAMLALALLSITAMLRRVLHLPVDERRRHLPFAATTAILLLPTLHSVWTELGGGAVTLFEQVELWAGMALPIVLAIGVVRHGVLDIDVVVRRATLYVCSAGVLALAYTAVVEALGLVVGTASATPRLTATATVAVIAAPVATRSRLALERRVFGNRRDPAQVLRALGTSLALPQGRDALTRIVHTIAEELRLPSVAIDLDLGGELLRTASVGDPSGPEHRVPLADRGRRVGELVVWGRTAAEPLGRRDVEILDDIARPVSIVAANVLLQEELVESRRLLVLARAEERRRIRRDLHDGLGPTLASVSLGISAAADQLGTSTELGALLHDLDTEVRDAVDDIRRLVHDLRPPALDDLGLVCAIAEHARTVSRRSGESGRHIEVTVDAEPVTVALPAAVEVALYRIALEAITNVARHADARRCAVRLRTDAHEILLEVEDDGQGFAGRAGSATEAGMGLRSMQDRAAELGGTLDVSTADGRGSRVSARLPIGTENS